MKFRHYSLWLLPLLFLISGKEEVSRQGTDYALFFAVDDYRSSERFGDLKNPVRDADAIAKELREMYDFETEVYKNYSRRKIYDVLRRWQNKTFQPEDQVFVFFSGHGDFDEFTSKGYYVAHGNRTKDDQAYIDLTTLGNIVTKIPCKHVLLAIDACYSGTIDQEIALKGKTFARANDGKQAEKNRLIQNQLRNKTRLLITSGGKRRTRDGVKHSPFAEALLRGLRGAYTYRDGLFLFSDLLSELERISPTPHEGELVGHEQGGFVFVAKDAVVPAAPVTRPTTPTTRRTSPSPDLPDMVFIQGGTFQMGDQFGDGYSDEKPVHSVTVSDFYLSNHEVTVEEYLAFSRENPSHVPEWMEKGSKYNARTGSDDHYKKLGSALEGDKHPIVGISWNNAIAYCNWKSEQSGLQKVYMINGSDVRANWAANGYRLPTEAEWEYAARSRGKKEKWAGTSTELELSKYSNDDGTDDGYEYTAPVKSFRANDLGLYDMSGNVWEWCWDWYDSDYYASSKNASDPRGPGTGSRRVSRGGSWDYTPGYCRAAYRYDSDPTYRSSFVGFRLASSSR